MDDRREDRAEGTAPLATPADGALRKVRSADLLGTAREVIIEHDGDRYRLRNTSKGKLILTK